MKNKICVLLLCIVTLFSMSIVLENNVEAVGTYYTESKTEVSSSNYSENNYIRYGGIVESYLNKNSDGTLQKVQLIYDSSDILKSKVLIEKYDTNFKLISSKEIKYELKICAGYYSGEKYNFLVFGQGNLADDDNVEVIRVVKYDKNWNKISHCSIKAINTYAPFDAGSCRMVEKNGILYIDTCHEMYKSSDGLHHQSNMLIKINEETMERVYARYGVSNIGTGYVSHSFNQYILIDDNYFYTVDHGDAHPRAVVLCKNQLDKNYPIEKVATYPISGKAGNNSTGVSVGGAELSSTSVIIAGNSVKQNEDINSESDYNEQRNIFLTITNKNTVTSENTKVKWLTNYPANGSVYCNTPHLVKVNDNKLVVIWEEVTSTATTIRAVMIDANGNNISNVITIGGRLSDCKPIIYNNKLTWYINTGEKAIFFAIDVSNATTFNSYNNQGIVDFTKFTHLEYKYNSEKEQYTICNFDNKVSSITLPKSQYPWMKIRLGNETFKDSSNIKNVVIPEGYTEVPTGCFSGATNLENVTFPSTLIKIGDMSFYNTKIQSLNIPDSVTIMERRAFASMSKLTNVKLPKNLKEISDLLFLGDELLESITIPSSVEKIGSYAFSSTGLKTITIPNSVKSIDYNAFYFCDRLRGTITIPASVTTIGEGAFAYDDNIEKIIIKNSGVAVGSKILSNEKMMVIGEKYKATEGLKFASVKSSNSNVTVSSDGTITAQKEGTATVECLDKDGNVVISTWVRVFKQKTPITKLELEKNVAYLKKGENINIRANCSPSQTTDYTGIIWTSSNPNVAKVDLLGKITAVANGKATITATCEANKEIKAICNVTVADSFTDKYEYKVLDDGTIKITKYMGGLTNVAIPSKIDGYTVTELGDYVFANYSKPDTSIKKITIPNTVTKIGSSFSYCKAIESITIPKSVKTIVQGFANYCDKLNAINVDANNTEYMSVDGVLYEKYNNNPYQLVLYPSGKQNKIFVLPSGTSRIDGWSLCDNNYLQEIRCLKNINSISINAVKNMPNLTKVYILDPKAAIGSSYYPTLAPFKDCPNMTIYGIKDSTAQEYANNNNVKFQVIDYKITSLKADKTSYNLTSTSTYNPITVTYEPQLATNTAFTYVSSDEKVATVDSYGRIKAVGNGKTEITVKATDGSNKSATIDVNVEIKCSSIRVYNKPEGKMKTKAYVTAYAIPMNAKNTTLKYTMKDTKIATVDQNGLITPVSKGTTELYIETTDGSNIKETIPITADVEVKLSSISLNKTTLTLSKGSAETLKVTYNPDNTTDSKTVAWKSSDTKIVTVYNGKVTAIASGTATITAIVGEKSATCTVTVPKEQTSQGGNTGSGTGNNTGENVGGNVGENTGDNTGNHTGSSTGGSAGETAGNYVLGDVDGNGKINSKDAVMILKYVVHNIDLNKTEMIAADTTKDGKVNSKDAVQILKYVVHNITEF